MKKIIALTLALGMTVGIASACGKKAEPTVEEETEKTEQETEEETEKVEDETEPVVTEEDVTTPDIPEDINENYPSALGYGVLYWVNVENHATYIHGIRLSGNQTGSEEFNSKELATDGIRCVFLLNEWIEVTLDDDAPDEMQVYVFKFVNDPNLYNDVNFNGDIEGYVAMATLTRPEEEGAGWGEFYVNPEDADPGDYSLIFVNNGVAVHQMKILLVAPNSIETLSDSELEALTK